MEYYFTASQKRHAKKGIQSMKKEKGSNVKITERTPVEKSISDGDMSHLKNAIYKTLPASVQDHTGYTPIVPETREEARSYQNLMNDPVTSKHKKK